MDAILKSLRDHQQRVIEKQQYECYSCGTFFHPDYDNELSLRDNWTGESNIVLVCDRCISLGWKEWHR
jgi:uncharacterized protein with PIN domain